MNDRERLIEILSVPIYPHEAADPAEVVADYLLDNGVTIERHGRWVRNEWADYVKECSVCGKAPNAIPGRGNTPCYSKVCPNCGAKMDVEGDG